MSTDWNVHCVDCNDTHGFNDANHEDKLMATLCKHADAIAALAPLLAEGSVTLHTYWGDVDPRWFAQHKGHKLVPISEYGDLLTQCIEYVTCTCGSMRRCTLDAGHKVDHDATERHKRP
jgi:hypothetical protein